MPRGREAEARAFYVDVLALQEIPKPPDLASRGGAWFVAGAVQIHLGVEDDFRPARKAHPAILVRHLSALLDKCKLQGFATTTDQPLPGYDRASMTPSATAWSFSSLWRRDLPVCPTSRPLTCAAKAHVPKSRGMAVAESTADAAMSELQLP
jgi:hypothetical protein